MTEDEFWEIVTQSDLNAQGDLDRQVLELQALVSRLPPTEIVSFGAHFEACMNRAYDWDVWAAACILRGGCSDDSFDDFRGTLIALGRETFESVTKDADLLRNVLDRLCFDDPEDELFIEGFQSVASNAYAESTGQELPDLPATDSQRHEPAGEPWDDRTDDLEKRCPLLWNAYGPADDSRTRTLAEARAAFSARDFKKALRAYSKIDESLDGMDQKKMDYCRRKV